MKKLRDFSAFNEAKNPLDPNYLGDVERRARQEHQDRMDRGEISRNPMQDIMPMVMELQDIQNQGNNIDRLEALAHVVINAYYGSILDGIEMDAKIVRPHDQELMELAEEMEEEEETPMIEVPETIMNMPFDIDDVDKRKLINNMIQGAAKNVHRIIHTPECREGLDEISARLFPLIDKLIKSNEVIEWSIPKEAGVDMMKGNPNGAVKVEWVEKPVIDKDEEEEEEGGEEEHRAQIFVRAIDFVIMLHEMVKGIYEAALGHGLPDQEEILAETDTLSDEFEDLKYGPYIKQDLDDFVVENDKVSEVPNGLEHFYGEMVQLPAVEFVELFKAMIAGTDEARKTVDEMIDGVIDPLIEWYKEEDLRKAGLGDEEYGDAVGPDGETPGDNDVFGSQFELPPEQVDNPYAEPAAEEGPLDYSTMSQYDLKSHMDVALDNEDFETAREIGKHLK